jgi:hypothetical protein
MPYEDIQLAGRSRGHRTVEPIEESKHMHKFFGFTGTILLVAAVVSLVATPLNVVGLVATTFTVNTDGDTADANVGDGACDVDTGTAGEQCTFRAAIEESNASVGTKDTIDFHIGSTWLPLDQIIGVSSALPEITDPVDIVGHNWNGGGIVLDGGGGSFDGLDISAGSSTVRRLTIRDFGGNGIYLHGTGGNLVAGNHIGPFGFLALTTDGNAGHGIYIDGGIGNIIGGDTAADRNVISGNGGDGICVENSGSNAVRGNNIGTNIAGTTALGNLQAGIRIVDAPNNTIGGTTSSRRNVVSGNKSSGISITGPSSINNYVQGNYIGTDVSGTTVISNTRSGVYIGGGSNNIVGGSGAGAGNVTSGNGGDGVHIANMGAVAQNNLVQGNYIGTDASGTAALGNSDGVVIRSGTNNVIGGTEPGAGNVIAFNFGHGVSFCSACTGNTTRGNAIWDNGGLGIDRGNDGPSTNDIPSLADVQLEGGSTEIAGGLSSTASTTFDLDFYASSTCDPSGYGEGQSYLGSAQISTDGNGDASFAVTLSDASSYDYVTVTATDPSGSTSEFSACYVLRYRIYLPLVLRQYP